MKKFQTSNVRNNGIDLIRGFSIILVILLHIYIRIPLENTIIDQTFSQRAINIIFHSGYYGVILFFVVSGFLITTTAISKWGNLQNVQCKQFYRLRFARIMPCLIAILLLLTIFDLLQIKGFVIHTTSLKQALFSALTFHINWLEAKTGYLPGGWDVLWSLSVEEVFYLFFPLICIFIRNEIAFILTMLVFVALGPLARTLISNDIWSDHSYLSCMDGIAIGCLAALFVSKLNINRTKAFRFLISGFTFFIVEIFYRPNQPVYLLVTWYFLILILSGLLGRLVAKYYSDPLNFFLRYKFKNHLLNIER